MILNVLIRFLLHNIQYKYWLYTGMHEHVCNIFFNERLGGFNMQMFLADVLHDHANTTS